MLNIYDDQEMCNCKICSNDIDTDTSITVELHFQHSSTVRLNVIGQLHHLPAGVCLTTRMV